MAEAFLYGSGGGLHKSILIVTAPAGSTVTCSREGTTKTAREKDGVWTFKGLDLGTWTVHAALEGQEASQEVVLERLEVVYLTMVYRMTPEFTYTGEYALVGDDDTPISDFPGWKDGWKLRLLTSGTLTITQMYGFGGTVDAFLVGGGASSNGDDGGGGGYTKTETGIALLTGTEYPVVIGGTGGTTSAFDLSASGGSGKNGGSGGGAGAEDGYDSGGSGGSDGSNGGNTYKGGTGGTGQGTTTREFAEEGGTLYSGGGAGKGGTRGSGTAGAGGGGGVSGSGTANTGGGGGGDGGIGGSGIVILRNAREVT